MSGNAKNDPEGHYIELVLFSTKENNGVLFLLKNNM